MFCSRPGCDGAGVRALTVRARIARMQRRERVSRVCTLRIAPRAGASRDALRDSCPAAPSNPRKSDLDPTLVHLGSAASPRAASLRFASPDHCLAAPSNPRGSDLDPTPTHLGSCSALFRCSKRKPKREQDQELSASPSGCPTYFSLRAHCAAGAARTPKAAPQGRRAGSPESREVSKRKGTPRPRPPRIPAPRVRVRRSGISTGLPWPDEILGRIPAANPAGNSTTSRRSPGAPGKARAPARRSHSAQG
jgi:hypothetical protein